MLPVDIVEAAGVFEAMASGGGSEPVGKVFRLTRLLKLLKLLRVLRASRVLARVQTRFAMTYTSTEMIK